jgi:hypothetical protein
MYGKIIYPRKRPSAELINEFKGIWTSTLADTMGRHGVMTSEIRPIFENIKLEETGYSQIRENFISLPILESQQDLYGLRDILLEFSFLQDTWLGRQFKSAGNSVADFAKTSPPWLVPILNWMHDISANLHP